MVEQIPEGMSLLTVFLISLITSGVGILGKIVFDWLKNRKNPDESKKANKNILDDLQAQITKSKTDDIQRKSEIVKLETNDLIHIQTSIDEIKEGVKGLWVEINKIKEDMSNINSDLSFIRGKMNGALK